MSTTPRHVIRTPGGGIAKDMTLSALKVADDEVCVTVKRKTDDGQIKVEKTFKLPRDF